MKRIEFVVKDKTFGIPNAWELLTPEQYMDVCRLLVDFAASRGSLSVEPCISDKICRASIN